MESVLYPSEGKTILSYANEISPPSSEVSGNFHIMLLKILRALPADLSKRVTDQIYEEYCKGDKNFKALPEVKRFIVAYKAYKDDPEKISEILGEDKP